MLKVLHKHYLVYPTKRKAQKESIREAVSNENRRQVDQKPLQINIKTGYYPIDSSIGQIQHIGAVLL